MQKQKSHHNARGVLPLVLALLCAALLVTSGAAAEETGEITPVVKLTFASVPENALTSAMINITVSTDLTELTKDALSTLSPKVDNAAYLVTLRPEGFSAADVTGATIQLPAPSAWTTVHKNTSAAVLTGGKAELVPVSLIGINDEKQIIFEADLTSLPDAVLLVSTATASIAAEAQANATATAAATAASPAAETTTPPESTQTPASALAFIILSAAAGYVYLSRRE